MKYILIKSSSCNINYQEIYPYIKSLSCNINYHEIYSHIRIYFNLLFINYYLLYFNLNDDTIPILGYSMGH